MDASCQARAASVLMAAEVTWPPRDHVTAYPCVTSSLHYVYFISRVRFDFGSYSKGLVLRLRCYLHCDSQLGVGSWTGDSFVSVGFGRREENVRFACRFTRVLSMVIAVVVAVKISLDVDSPPGRLLTVVRQLNCRSRAGPNFKWELRWQKRCSLFSNLGSSLSASTSSTSAS